MSEPIYFSTNSHPISNPTTQIMRVDLDGGFTVNESIQATDAAKEVLRIMKEQWFADAQATKIREQEEYINRLVKAGNYLDECLLSIAGENLPAKQLWHKAKEDKL